MKKIVLSYIFSFLFISANGIASEDITPIEVLNRSYDNQLGKNSISELKMTIVRPQWQRELTLKSWSYGRDYYLIYILSPARDKGQVFLKRENNLWNWIPNINRSIKIPSSMMSGSWMGSDFSNNDLVRERTYVNDYNSKFLDDETKQGFDSYKIELIAKETAPVIWSKIEVWVDKEHFNVVQADFFNEDNEVISRQEMSDFKYFSDSFLPGIVTITPLKDEGHSTVIETINIEFDLDDIDEEMFSIQRMKNIRP